MRFNSLSWRLLFGAALVLPLFMLLTGLSLQQAFRHSQLSAEEEFLRSQVYVILAVAELEGEKIVVPELLSAPRLNQLQSGLYAFVQQKGDLRWQSASAASLSLSYQRKLPETDSAGEELFLPNSIDHYFVYAYHLIWEEDGQEQAFQISILHSKNGFYENLQRFQSSLWRWLSVATAGLLIILLLVLRWGLSPLRQLGADLKQVEQGYADRLQGDYPQELATLAQNLNELLAHEQAQRQRYSNTLGDLAHSLKTPLAVVQGELSKSAIDQVVLSEQCQRMNEIVQHQLSRAVRGQASLSEDAVAVADVVQRLLAAMNKVYAAKALEVGMDVHAECLFKGDERDLMEMLGNVIDNAYKHAQQHIRITAVQEENSRLRISVEDDGAGLSEDQRALIQGRGVRLDSQQPGQGIGLAVVADIVDAYGGKLELQDSEWGGLRVHLSFSALP